EYLFGAGLGFTMQTIVTAVQNSVDRRDMGSATSSITFFRQMGGSVGAALFGAVLSSRLAHYLAEQGAGGPQVGANNIQAIQQLTEPFKSVVLGAFTNALDDVFLIGVPFVAVAFVVALLLREQPLRTG
ncbi:MAG TPA: MFS transporter, partial [Actinomycetota bacterium]|nr:MFS transporter [Actinomycetota bacterium]